METLDWQIEPKQYNTYKLLKKFGNTVYQLTVYVDKSDKTIKYYVGLSSGKKRKELEIYIDKDGKSDGGIKALLWVVKSMLSFPDYYREKCYKTYKNEYMCINWADARRRNIYKRLEKYGFFFMHDDGGKTLMKKLK